MAALLLCRCLSGGECIQVHDGAIRASDLAPVAPEATRIDPATVLDRAPAPGLTRRIRGQELAWLLRPHGVELDSPPTVCVQRAAGELPDQVLLDAMRAALPADAQIELLDRSRMPVPDGRVVFSKAALQKAAARRGAEPLYLWKGKLMYDESHSLAVWALVRIQITRKVVIAVHELTPGVPIQPVDIRLGPHAVLLNESAYEDHMERVVGRTPRRRIPAGAPIPGAQLSEPRLIHPRDEVVLEANAGHARVSVPARALTGGRRGDMIVVENGMTGKRVQARVTETGKAIVESSHESRSDKRGLSLGVMAGGGSGRRAETGLRPLDAARQADSGR